MSFTLADAVVFFRGDQSQLESDLGSAEKKTESSAGNMAKMLGGAIVGGAAIAGTAILAIGSQAFSVATDIDAATDQIGASLGLGADEAKAYGETIKSVYGNNFGDSIADVGTAVENVAKQFKLAAGDPALKTMTENAFRLRDVFGTDVSESVDAVKTLMEQFGITSDEAFGFVAKGMQEGLDRSGDFLDTIGEYSVQFAEGGASAGNFFSVLETGLQGGMLGTDKAADLFKEFRVRIQDGSKTTKEALESIGINVDDMAAKMADGSMTALQAFDVVTSAIKDTDDANIRMQAGVGLLGSQFEDLGEKGALAIDPYVTAVDKMSDIAGTLDTKYTSLGSTVEGMWRKFQVGIAPAGEALLGLVNDNMPTVQTAVDTATGLLVGAVNSLVTAIDTAKTAWNDDWAGIRSTWETFAGDLPAEQQRFWDEWNKTFVAGSGQNKVSWEGFFSGLSTFTAGWWRLTIENWTLSLGLIRGEWKLFSSLFQGDWQGTWDGFKEAVFSVTDIILNYIEFAFGPDLRDKMAGALGGMWDGMKDVWDDVKSWWDSTFGALLGMAGIGMPDLAIVNPVNTGAGQTVRDILGGSGGFAQGAGANYAFGDIHVSVGNGADPYEAGKKVVRGITDEMRARGH